MYVCIYVCIYIYIRARVGVHMHSWRHILFICTVQSLYYMRVYHRCFLTLACMCGGGLEVGFVSACSWLALVTGVHQAFGAWCRSCFQQPIRSSPPQSQSAQIPTLEQLFWAPFLKYIRSVEPDWLRPHPVACPRNDLRNKTLYWSCTVSPDFF